MVWKELKSDKKVVMYHESDNPESDLIDEIIIKEENNTEINVSFKISPGDPYDMLIIRNNKNDDSIVFYLAKDPELEDPFFTYKDYFEKTNAEEAAEDIKKYILSLVSDILELN